MSNSKVISRDSLTAYERWELPQVGEPLPAARLVEKEPEPDDDDRPRAPTAEEIEQIQTQAYDEAYKEGYAKGEQEGHAAGQQQGHQQGLEQGLAEGQAAIRERVAQLDSLIAGLAQPYAKMDEQVEQELVALAMAVARHLVRCEVKTDPGQIVAAVRQAVSSLPSASRDVRVYLHPEDAALVREAFSLNEGDDGERRWRIVEEPVLSRGGCKVETENSRIDATVEARLAAIIAQALGGERDSDTDAV